MNRRPVSPLVMRALEIAEKHLGIAELASRLGATEALVREWQTGAAEMPDKEFLQLVDLLTDIEPGWMRPEPKR